ALYSRSRARNLSRRNMHSIIQQALSVFLRGSNLSAVGLVRQGFEPLCLEKRSFKSIYRLL
ncbi:MULTISPECIES: hypothetical protein, partial [unclassified Microcoleus]|uniref:hypothetical protein n=1 Tax=unclassified Microcoleus TaxID=2642155 RepID=UPI002FD0D8F5